jgi:hypothetical protein
MPRFCSVWRFVFRPVFITWASLRICASCVETRRATSLRVYDLFTGCKGTFFIWNNGMECILHGIPVILHGIIYIPYRIRNIPCRI